MVQLRKAWIAPSYDTKNKILSWLNKKLWISEDTFKGLVFLKKFWRSSLIIYSWTLKMAAMEVRATLGFLGVLRQMGVMSEAKIERFSQKRSGSRQKCQS